MKVLLQSMPRLLHDIVTDVVRRQPDMEISDPALFAAPTLERDEPDVVIVGTVEPEHAEEPVELLLRWPRIRVVMVSVSGPDAVMYVMRPHKMPLGEMSPARLVEVIRFGGAHRAD